MFPLGDSGKWVLIGSLYKTNQWWVGSLSGDPPRFTPDHVGIVDFGNGYAAKTGTTWQQKGTERRLVFGFTGWQEPTAPTGCGRYLIMPRDLSVVSNRLEVTPIPETKVLRVPSSKKTTTVEADGDASTIASGSQVEISLSCTGTASSGKVAIRTLASSDDKYFTEIGYDFGDKKMPFYVDHSHCCTAPNTIVQKAISGGAQSSLSNMTVFVVSARILCVILNTVSRLHMMRFVLLPSACGLIESGWRAHRSICSRHSDYSTSQSRRGRRRSARSPEDNGSQHRNRREMRSGELYPQVLTIVETTE